jgi:hypothetical protein
LRGVEGEVSRAEGFAMKITDAFDMVMVVVFACMVAALFTLGDLLLTARKQKNEFRQEAVDRGFAEYNPTNGVWGWREGIVRAEQPSAKEGWAWRLEEKDATTTNAGPIKIETVWEWSDKPKDGDITHTPRIQSLPTVPYMPKYSTTNYILRLKDGVWVLEEKE